MKKTLVVLLSIVVLALPSSAGNDTDRIQRQLMEGSCTLVTSNGDEAPAWCLSDRPLILVADRYFGDDSGHYRSRWTVTRADWPDTAAEVLPVSGAWGELAFFWRASPLPRGCRLRPLRLASSMPQQGDAVYALDDRGELLEGSILRSSSRQSRVVFDGDPDVPAGTAIVDTRCQVVGVAGSSRRDRGGGWYYEYEPVEEYRATLEDIKRRIREEGRRR